MAPGEGEGRRDERRPEGGGGQHDGSATAGRLRAVVATSAAVWRAGWWRFALLLVLVTAAFGLGGMVVLAWFHQVAVSQGPSLLDGADVSTRGWVVLALEVGIPAVVLTAVTMLSGVAAMAQLSDDIQAGRPPRLGRAVRRGLRRMPSALGVTIAYLAMVALLVLATPVLVLVGLLGLVLTPIALLARRRRPSLRWPAPRTLVVLAVPFGALAYASVRWGLALPAAAVERNRPRAALRRSAALVEGRWWSTAVALAGALVAVVVVEALAYALGDLLSVRAGAGLRLTVQLLVSAVPVIVAVALFRAAAPTSPAELAVVDPPPRPGSRGPVVTGVAVPVVLALFATGAAVGTVTVVGARPAAAAPSFTVTDLADTSDATPGDGTCATAAATCTLRAAVEEANALASGTVTIAFAGDGTVHWTGGPIVVTADVDITGAGHHVVLDGRSCAGCSDPKQLFRLTNAAGSFHLARVELANGATSSVNGGAAIETVAANASVDDVTFFQHTATAAPGGAVAVLGGSFTARNATFVGNSATAGADVYDAGGFVMLKQATLWHAVGGSIANLDSAGGTLQLANTIVDPTSGRSCTGNVMAFTVLSSDGTCGGAAVAPQLGTLANHGGDVRTVDLLPTSPAIDQGDPDLCLPTDARGITRPQFNRCDPGAVEIVPTTSAVTFVVNDLGDAPDAGTGDGVCLTATGTCTLRAAVQQATATSTSAPIAAPTYTITFSVSGTITVGSVLDVAAAVTIDGTGQKVEVSGGDASQVFRFGDSRWPFTLRAIVVRDGHLADSFGGAGVYAATNGTIDAVTFMGNVNATTFAPGLAGGGAVSVDSFRTVTVVNSTFDNDSVDANLGGADLFVRGSAIVNASTFAEAYGGSVYADPAYGGTITMRSSALKSVTGFNCTGSISGTSNVSSDSSTCGGGLTGTDPLFAALGDHGGPVPTRTLSLGSQAINAGDNATCPPTDARGISRPQGGVCDAGAVEYVNSTSVTVTGSVNPSVLTQDVTVSADVVNGDGVVPTGTVTFKEGATVLGTGTLAPAGTGANATLLVSGLTVGSHVITADYGGDAALAPSSGSYTQVVSTPATVVTVTTPGTTVHGQPVTVSASVAAPGVSTPATGTLTFREGATVLGTASAPSGSVVVPAPALGSHTYAVDYAGDAVYPAASGSATNAVGAAATSLAVTSAGPTVFGQGATYTATVTVVAPGVGIPTGSVVFTSGATTLGSAALDAAGVATLTDATLDVGSHPITATFAGGSSFGGSSGGTTQVVNQAATSLALAGSPNPSVHGQSVTVTATVTATAPGAGTPTGTVSFFDGATPLGSASLDGSGVASLPVGGLTTGSHSISATYAGATRYVVSAGSATQVVDPSPTAVAVSSAPTVTGQGISVTATVSPVAPGAGTPSGTVTVREGATVLGTGTLTAGAATVAIAALPVGAHTLTVDYAGDADFVASTGSGSHSVAAAATSVAASVVGGGTVHGQSVTVTATVAAVAPGNGTPTGTVTFHDGATTLGTATLDGAGTASVSSSVLATGTRTITVDYAGDGSFATSSGTTTHTVSPAATTTAVTTSGSPSVLGAPVTFTATVAVTAPGTGTPTGTVTFADGATTIGTGTLDGSGTASVTTPSLGVGAHTITATYGGDADDLTSSGTVAHDVGAAGASVNVVAGAATSVVGESVTFTATVAAVPAGPVPTGVVTFADGATTLGTGTLDGAGVASITTGALGVGPHGIVATYAGDGTVGAGASSPLAHTVGQAATSTAVVSSGSPSVVGESVTFTATVSVSAPGAGTPTGSVTFTDGATTIGSGSLDGTGKASVSTSALAVGPHTVTATYAGDPSFGGSSSTVGQSVGQAATSTAVVSSGSPSVVGQSVTFTATVSVSAPGAGTPTGSVTFTDGATTIGSGSLDGTGKASVSTSALAVGPHTVTATYAGDPSFGGSSSTVGQSVGQAATSTAVVSSGSPSVVGQSVTFTATVSVSAPGAGTPTGSVTFTDGATTIGSGSLDGTGKASVSTSALAVGPHTITATYGGSASQSGSSGVAAQAVGRAATSTAVVSSGSPSVVGQSVTFTATVTVGAPGGGIPTGTVTFTDGATTIGSGSLDAAGKASVSTSALAVGPHTITATYAGSVSFAGSSSTVGQSVGQAATSTAVTSSGSPSVVGQSVTFTATVSVSAPGAGTPTGSVTFTDGATTIGSGSLDGTGKASVSTSALAVGPHTVTATYTGSASFAGSSATTGQSVSQAATTTAVTSSANPSVVGQPVTFTATVTPVGTSVVPTGTVDFTSGATLLGSSPVGGGGVASLTTAALGLGVSTITASYRGTVDHAASSSSPLTQTVSAAGSTVTLTSSANPSVSGQSITLTGHVTSIPAGTTPTGSLTFVDGATTIGSAPLDGTGTATITTSPAAGTHGLAAVYAGDGTVGPGSSTTLAQVVAPAATTTAVVAAPTTAVTGQSVTLTATVAVSAPGSGTPTGVVTFTDGASTLGSATLDAGGVASLPTSSLAVGSHTVTATYGGDPDRATSSSTATVGVSPAATTTAVALSADPISFGQTVTVTATVAAVAPGAGSPTGSVTFREGATSLGTVAVDAAGTASLPLQPATGSHTITADYAGDASFSASTGSTTSTVQPATTTVTITPAANPITYGTDATFVVQATTSTGPVPTGCVDVRVGGTTQVCTTLDGTGRATATLSPRPTPGSYVVDATYAGTADVTSATSAPVTLVVDPAPSAVALAASPVAFSAVGQSVTLTATVTGPASVPTPAGTVTFVDGASVLATVPVGPSGQATTSVATLALGSHSLAATYSSTNGLTASSSPLLTHLVVAAGTTTSITSSPNPSVAGQPVTATAAVAAVAPGAGIPSGVVTFRDGSTVLGAATLDAAGVATLPVANLGVGAHSLTAAYAAAGGYSASTSPATTHTVDPAATSTAVTTSPAPTVTGQAVTATATVSTVAPGGGTPTGTVTFSIGGSTVGTATLDAAGTASATFIPSGGGGGVPILATYGGDPSHQGSSGGVLHQVDAAATTVAVSSTPAAPVAGDLVTITATVSVVAPGGGVPTGQVTFTDGATTLGTALVDGTGKATIQRQSPDFFFRGTHQITATFTGGGSYASSSSSPTTIVVGLAPAVVTIAADVATPATGTPVTFTATLSTPLTVPVGTSITFSEGASVLATVPVTWNGTTLVATFTTSSLATGAHTITATYDGTVDISSATASTSVSVGLLPTQVQLIDPGPSLPGQQVSLFAVVRNTASSAVPTGSVRFTIDGAVQPDVALVAGVPGTASAAVAATFTTPGPHTVDASYLPTGSFVASSTTGTHQVGQYLPRLSLAAPSGGTWGTPLTFTVSMANVGVTPLVAPTGQIVLDDGAGHSCRASAYNATVLASATCTITFPNAGPATVTASYAGDASWGSASTARSLILDRRASGITGGVANGTPFTGEDTTLAWQVNGPTVGSVTTSLSSGATCASTALVGSCPIRYPLGADGVAQPITVTYGGDRDWAPSSFSTSLTPVGCYSLTLAANPPEGGSLSTNPSPSCDGGSGFARGTPVSITATPAAGYRVRYLSPLQGYGTEALVTAGPAEAGGTRYAFADFVPLSTCYTVTYDTELVARADASFFAVTQPNCVVDANGFAGPGTGSWTPSTNRLTPRAVVGRFQAGTAVRFRNVVGTNGPPSRLYGYRYGYRGNPLTPGATPLDSLTVDADKDITAVFGPICRRVTAATDGAPGASVSVSPATDCQDPDGPGYLPSTTATVTARVVGDGAFIDSWRLDRTDVPADAKQTTEVGPPPGNARTNVVTATLDVPFADGRNHDVLARFSACRALQVSTVGGGEGNITTTPAKGDCPTRRDEGGGDLPGRTGVQAPRTLYFLPGTKVDLVAGGLSDDKNQLLNVFDGWGDDVPTTRDQLGRANPRASVTVDRDIEVKGFFYPLHDCNTLFVKVQPAGAGTVTVDGDDGLCPFRDLAKPISTKGSGMFMEPGVFTLTAQAAKGKPLAGWTLPHGEEYSDQYVEYTVPGAQTSVNMRYTGQVTASFCQRLDAKVTLVSPSGTSRTGPVPEGSDLIGVDPAPNCPFADDAWLVGTTVTVAALGDPTGFEFTGWKGATNATTMATTITLDGSSPSLDLTAGYNLKCYKLIVEPSSKVDRSDEPNCPDEPTAYDMYLGGATVTLSGRLPSSSVFTGWAGDVERTGDVPVTWVVMDGDKTVKYTYRDMTTGEKISDAVSQAGDQIAIGAKKAVGVVAAAMVALVNDAPPLGVMNDVMALATGFDSLMRLVGVDVGVTQYLAYAQQTVKWLTSTLTCASVWGLSSAETPAGTSNAATREIDKISNIQRRQQLADEAAQGLAQAEARRTFTSVGATSGGLGVMSVKETTSKVNQAKLKFAKFKKYRADKSVKKAKIGAGIGVGLEIYNIVDGAGGIGWDSDASSAWTNGDAFMSCSKDMVPDYVVDAMGGEGGG
ncbi:MAG: Ig-like domain-containing protein [Acidimicrobiales bacterium]